MWGLLILIISIIVIREFYVYNSIYSILGFVLILVALYYRQVAIDRRNIEIKERAIANALIPYIKEETASTILTSKLIEEYGNYGNVTDLFFLVCFANGEQRKYSVVEQAIRKNEMLIIVTMTPREIE